MKSNLQIISGKYRGRKLALPSDARPTQNRARAAVFNMLKSLRDFTQPFTVWDAFAGSGAFGIEFLSRFENAKVVFTDKSESSVATIKKNLKDISNGTVIKTDALSVIQSYGSESDIIFVDPPYADAGLAVVFIKKLIKVLKPGAIVVWEIEKAFDFEFKEENIEILKDKNYGRARFLIFSKN